MRPRTYLITASTGIGAETARLLAKNGHQVFVVSRTESHCESLARELSALGGLDEENFREYLKDPDIPAIGGSWIVNPVLVKQENWKEITVRSTCFVDRLKAN